MPWHDADVRALPREQIRVRGAVRRVGVEHGAQRHLHLDVGEDRRPRSASGSVVPRSRSYRSTIACATRLVEADVARDPPAQPFRAERLGRRAGGTAASRRPSSPRAAARPRPRRPQRLDRAGGQDSRRRPSGGTASCRSTPAGPTSPALAPRRSVDGKRTQRADVVDRGFLAHGVGHDRGPFRVERRERRAALHDRAREQSRATAATRARAAPVRRPPTRRTRRHAPDRRRTKPRVSCSHSSAHNEVAHAAVRDATRAARVEEAERAEPVVDASRRRRPARPRAARRRTRVAPTRR